MTKIGITERGDFAFDLSADKWVTDGKPAIIVTKNFAAVHERLGSRANILYHATITGLGGTFYEPGVVPSASQLLYIKDNIPDEYKSHVVIRIDPIIPNQSGLAEAIDIYKFAENNGFKTRVSILDMYNHVKSRLMEVSKDDDLLRSVCDNLINSYDGGLHYPLDNRKQILNMFFPNAQVCGEPDIPSSGCINKEVCDILGIEYEEPSNFKPRVGCMCNGQKFELLNNKHPCGHKCIYCYWKD